jgi:hypothetical protein
MTTRICTALTLLVALAATAAGAADAADDRYLAGYAAAILERQLRMSPPPLTVRNGVITVDVRSLEPARRDEVLAALSGIPGAREVRVSGAAPPGASPSPGGPASPAAAEGPRPTLGPTDLGLLPGGQLFNPLLADPRWPHFGASIQRYVDDRQLRNVSAVSLGETVSVYRDRLGPGFWEVGLQAGVFALFDLDAESLDLINADYFIAAIGSYRLDRFAALARLSHTSSHLGDEFLLANRVQRINLSYETLDAKLSYDVGPWLGESSEAGTPLRVYVGGGYHVVRDPESLKPWAAQAGVEVRSPWTLGGTRIRPVGGVDVQMREENNWSADLSARAGLQFDGVLLTRKMQILLEYFHGHSPNGQFHRQRIDYLGLGVHFNF